MVPLTIDWVLGQLARYTPVKLDEQVAPRRAAVALILGEPLPRQDLSILFIHRSRDDHDPWSGHMAFPGGRLEPVDASARHAAERETLEEVGIDLHADAELLGQLDDQQAAAKGVMLPMAISPFVYHLLRPVNLRTNDEVAEALWIPVHHLLDPRSVGAIAYEREGARLDLPCLTYSERVIWGLTYLMLTRFFFLVGWTVEPELVET